MNERDIFLAAIEIANADERLAYLDRVCHGNAKLRAEIDELLKNHAEASQFLESPAVAADSAVDQTIQTGASDNGSGAENASDEVQFRKYLESATRPGWLGRMAHYEIEEILGRGAFGIVAKAFDEKLHRVVAIKLMSPELASTSPPRKRFLREARTAAAVTHENIVAIHAVEEEPIPYLVMEYIPGLTLQQHMDGNGPLDVTEVLRIGQQVASGLAAAHAANLIHRDIKPSNIMLSDGPNARVKISDFGLARAVDDASMTKSGMIAGTPMYMAPEQARGETLDHRADLFSLGSVLYQMVGGRPPFRATNTVAVLKRVCEDTPRSLGDVLPGTPDWLEAIIFRLLEKERSARFQSAKEVDDLLTRCQRELEHNGQVTCVEGCSNKAQTEFAGPTTSTHSRAKKNPVGWLIGAVIAVAAVIGVMLMNDGAGTTLPDLKDSPGTATSVSPPESSLSDAELGTWGAWDFGSWGDALEPAEALKQLTREDISPSALAVAGNGDPANVPATLVAVFGNEHPVHANGISAITYSPDGRWLVTGGNDFRILVREPASGQVIRVLTGHEAVIERVAFSPDSKTLVSGSRDGVIRLWPLEDEAAQPVKLTTLSSDMHLAVSPDGRFLAAGGGEGPVNLWRWSRWDSSIQISAIDSGSLSAIAFSPDGSTLACAWNQVNPPQRIHLFSTADGTPQQTLQGHTSAVYSLVFSPDSKHLASSGKNDLTRLWDLDAGDSVEVGEPGRIQFSPDGNTIVTLTRFGFFTHDVPAQKTKREHMFPFWNSGIQAFSPDGDTLAVGDGVGDIRFYETKGWTPLDRTLEEGHSSTVFAIGIHPDGDRLYSVGADRTIRQWNVQQSTNGQVVQHLTYQSSLLAIDPQGGGFATGSKFACWKDMGKNYGVTERFVEPIDLVSLAYSTDGRTIAGIGQWDSTVYLFDSQYGKELHRFTQLKHSGYKLAFDDGCLAAGGKNGEVLLWRTSDGTELESWTTSPLSCIAIRPHSDDVVTGHDDGVIRYWIRTSGQPKVVREYHTHQRLFGLRFTPDGTLLLSTSRDNGMLQIRAADQKHEKPLAVIPVVPGKIIPGSQPVVFDVDRSGQFIFASGPTSSIYIHRISRDLWNNGP